MRGSRGIGESIIRKSIIIILVCVFVSINVYFRFSGYGRELEIFLIIVYCFLGLTVVKTLFDLVKGILMIKQSKNPESVDKINNLQDKIEVISDNTNYIINKYLPAIFFGIILLILEYMGIKTWNEDGYYLFFFTLPLWIYVVYKLKK